MAVTLANLFLQNYSPVLIFIPVLLFPLGANTYSDSFSRLHING